MKHILLLSKSYFHKAKGRAVSIGALILLSVTLLNVGLVMQVGMSTFFDERAEALNAGHFAAVIDSRFDVEEIEHFLINHENVVDVERNEILSSLGSFFIGDNESTNNLILATNTSTITMNPLTLIGDHLPLEGDVIYIPHFLMHDNSYEIGDPIHLVFSEQEITFTVGGSTEEILFGTAMGNFIRFYVSDDKFQALQAEFPLATQTLLTARGETNEIGTALRIDFDNEIFTSDSNSLMGILAATHQAARNNRTFFPTILSLVMLVLAMLLIIVSVIVVRFSVSSHVEEQIKNLGILKAVGYRNKQIIHSLLLKFFMITTIGSLLGIILAVITLPLVATVMEGQVGLVWRPQLNLLIGALTLIVTIGLILFMTYLSARRIKTLYPLMALRDGMASSRQVKKNYFLLEKARLPLTPLLAFKQMLQSKKQMVTMVLIVTGLMMISTVTLTIYYNMVVDNEAFAQMVAGVAVDAAIGIREGEDIRGIVEQIEAMPEVERVHGNAGGLRATVNDVHIFFEVSENPNYLGDHMLVEGRFPNDKTEIAISPVLANLDGFAIGEIVVVKRGDTTEEFLVTGIIQAFQNAGLFSLLTEDGFQRLEPHFEFSVFYVNLIHGADVDTFIEDIIANEGDVFELTLSFEAEMGAILGGMGAALTPVAFGSIIVSGVVVVLVLYMLIKMMLIRRYKELGIQKALGFTNMQLMNQVALNLLPVVIVGAIFGAVIGYFSFNTVFGAVARGEGIAVANLPTPSNLIILLVVGMVVLSYLVAIVLARRIRKISAYALISE